jgi:hypothetical protein
MDKIKNGNAEPLGDKVIDGRKAQGYKVLNSEVWADAETADPIEITVRETDPQGNVNRISITDIRMNIPLDDSVFSMEKPEGYKDVNHLSIEDMVEIQQQNKAAFIVPSVSAP